MPETRAAVWQYGAPAGSGPWGSLVELTVDVTATGVSAEWEANDADSTHPSARERLLNQLATIEAIRRGAVASERRAR